MRRAILKAMTKGELVTSIMSTASWIASTAERCETQPQITTADLDKIADLLQQAETHLGNALARVRE
jgi:hypothetical protein